MYFPKVELTPDEITRLYTVGHVRPEWLRTVVVNQDDVEAILSQKPKRLSKAKALEAFVNAYQEHQELWADIEAYSRGELDRIDLSVKYGLYYKDLKKVFTACFERDIEPLWKAHKKSAQKKTSQKLYGTDHPSLNEEVRAKQKQTMLTRYGVEHNMQSKELREKHKQSMLETYGVAYAFELGKPKKPRTQTEGKDNAKIPVDYEQLVISQLDASNIAYKRNDRTILAGLELGFYLPEFKLGIECNPNQTHNSNVYATDGRRVMFGRIKGKTYHFDKYRKAKDAGVTLIQWWEQDLEPTTFLKTTRPRLLARLFGGDRKIGARQVTMKPVKDAKPIRAFIDEHHARGNAKAKEYWGFYKGDELVAAASFVWKGDEAELKRLCFAPTVQILGGISKLITNFFREHPETEQS